MSNFEIEGPAVSSNITRKIERAPPHVRAGLDAYRAALNKRQDWHRAVWAAIDAAIAHKEAIEEIGRLR